MAGSNGGLFSEYFVTDGIAEMPGWDDIDDAALEEARATITGLLADFDARPGPSEADTEDDLIEPLFELLGWQHSSQVTASRKGRSDVPDYVLFADADAKAVSVREENTADRYRHGAAIAEAKAWDISLDKSGDEIGRGAPSTQILRYLGTVGVQSEDAIRFGILTNGRIWRLYDDKARARLEDFVEIDLKEAVGLVVPAEKPDEDASDENKADRLLRTFLWLFARDSLSPDTGGETRTGRAIAESRSFEARVTEQLADTVFDTVFADLASALGRADPERPAEAGPAYLADLREAALTWLYRLLFVLYAEDRRLLPTRTRSDGLWATRKTVAAVRDGDEEPSGRRTNFDGDLRDLWRQIDGGDEDIGLPPYNGGLFLRARSPLLERAVIPDAAFAPLLDALSRERTGDAPRFINYRDLDVQHLGSVYEKLLEYDLQLEEGDDFAVTVKPKTFARKTSGSYYTPEELVMLVIRRTVGPLLDERRAAFAEAVVEEAKSTQTKDAPEYPLARLRDLDPASEFLTLRICDPAMGSGHFLVSLVDYLADQVMVEAEESAKLVEFGDYVSPLLERLATIRDHIIANAEQHGWRVDEAQLVDRQLVRRIILKRVIYGVDKNPMAVELAKLSLWLHTFTVGAPLSFLDHHLRCGDSLFGEFVRPAVDRLGEASPLFAAEVTQALQEAVRGMDVIEELTDADIAEVHQSRDTYDEISERIAPHVKTLGLLQGYRWIRGSWLDARKQAKKLQREADRIVDDKDKSFELTKQAWEMKRKGNALELLLEGQLGEPDRVLDQCYGRIGDSREALAEEEPALVPLVRAAEIADISNFLHWEIAFPKVWRDVTSGEPKGGFDAIIGNPPWDRLKMQEVEWFASRREEIAKAPRAADRKRMIRELKQAGDPLADDYDRAAEMAKLAAGMATRKPELGGQYPLLGKGDVNLYSLFVERAMRLVNPRGIVGLLTPSGIAGDLSASAFFREVSTTGRLAALLDYANRPVKGAGLFFDDVDSRFKFCVLVFTGRRRDFAAAECGFFLTATSEIGLAEQTFPLTPGDFAAVNPNTGTAPVFRSPKDAGLTTSIYARVPVLIDHSVDEEERPWRVKYLRMFDMTNDSDKFLTAAELKGDGWYPVAGCRWQRGNESAVPLYVGRMFNQFDHRAAGVDVNEENLHNPALSSHSTAEQKSDSSFNVLPQYWVSWNDVDPKVEWTLGFRDIARTTDARTMISAILPSAAFGNKAPLLLTESAKHASLLVANFNAMALDYVVRQKMQSTSVNLYILEQFPILPPSAYDSSFGAMTAREIVDREVLRLTYTAHDIAAFARDMGHVDDDGEALPPFAWDEADRRQRRARLDALYFHLYGLTRDEADYVLSSFPIVRRHEEAEFDCYLTRDLILAQMAALDAGDTEAVIDIP